MAAPDINRSESFSQGPSAYWRQNLVGAAALETIDGRLRLINRQPAADHYSNAQLDDYRPAQRQPLPWHPPLRLQLRARFSHAAADLRGTAGFGFWNYPLTLFDRRLPRLPRALWFFCCAPPGNMKFDLLCPGQGWKAATFDSGRPAALALAPLAPLAVPLMQLPLLYQALWPIAQRAAGIRETLVAADMREWHDYTIEWGRRYSRFLVDGVPVLDRAPSPRGPLCFVVWIDNQFLVLTPQGQMRWGLTANPADQWLELERWQVLIGSHDVASL